MGFTPFRSRPKIISTSHRLSGIPASGASDGQALEDGRRRVSPEPGEQCNLQAQDLTVGLPEGVDQVNIVDFSDEKA